MAARSFQLTLAATPTRLSDAYIGLTDASRGGNIGGAPGLPDARSDVPYRQIVIQAAGAAAFVGGSDMAASALSPDANHGPVSSTIYGVRLDSTATVPAQIFGAYETGPMKLSDLWAAGAGATLHILAFPF